MDKLFYHTFDDLFENVKTQRFSNYETKEITDGYELTMNIAGLGKEDIDLSVESNELIIKSNNEEIKLNKRFILPKNVNEEKISAEVKHGLLKATIPKKEKMRILIE